MRRVWKASNRTKLRRLPKGDFLRMNGAERSPPRFPLLFEHLSPFFVVAAVVVAVGAGAAALQPSGFGAVPFNGTFQALFKGMLRGPAEFPADLRTVDRTTTVVPGTAFGRQTQRLGFPYNFNMPRITSRFVRGVVRISILPQEGEYGANIIAQEKGH